MVCQECVFGFFYDPVKMGISVASLALSVLFFVLMRRQAEPRRKALLIYAHLFTLIFPVVFYIFTNSCIRISGAGFCNSLKPALTIFLVTLLASVIMGYLLTPLMLRISPRTSRVTNHRLEGFVEAESSKLGMRKPSLHLIDTAKPIAFCVSIFRPRIYVSIGMADLLSKKELEAVLLHEVGHLKHHSSWLEFSTYLHRLASPFSVFTDFNSVFRQAEREADAFAVAGQGTAKHLLGAKRKVEEFERCC